MIEPEYTFVGVRGGLTAALASISDQPGIVTFIVYNYLSAY